MQSDIQITIYLYNRLYIIDIQDMPKIIKMILHVEINHEKRIEFFCKSNLIKFFKQK